MELRYPRKTPANCTLPGSNRNHKEAPPSMPVDYPHRQSGMMMRNKCRTRLCLHPPMYKVFHLQRRRKYDLPGDMSKFPSHPLRAYNTLPGWRSHNGLLVDNPSLGRGRKKSVIRNRHNLHSPKARGTRLCFHPRGTHENTWCRSRHRRPPGHRCRP